MELIEVEIKKPPIRQVVLLYNQGQMNYVTGWWDGDKFHYVKNHFYTKVWDGSRLKDKTRYYGEIFDALTEYITHWAILPTKPKG